MATDHGTGELGAARLETELRRTEEALAVAERRLAQLGEWGQVGFWELDMRTNDVYVSTQAFRILQLETASLREFVQHVHPDDRALIVHVADRARTQPGPYRAVHRVGQGVETRVLQHNMQSVVGEDGRPHRLLGFVTDVTAEHVVEEQLHRTAAQASLAVLAAGIVHDLNNAFTVVHGHATLALQAAEQGRAVDTVQLESIQRAATSAQELTRSLLSLGRQEALPPQRFSPRPLLERVYSLATTTLGRGREVTMDPGDGEIDVVADPGRLERVLFDLLVNARDALPPGAGSVELRLERRSLDDDDPLVAAGAVAPGLYAVFVVRDDGCGMGGETPARVVEPFFTTKPNGSGSGVGLASAEAFARRSGGALQIASRPGEGTTVTLHLPGLVTPARGTASQAPARRVLVAAADPQRRRRWCEIVTGSWIQVVQASDPDAARTILRTEPIDLIVADEIIGVAVHTDPMRSSPGRATLLVVASGGWQVPPHPSVVVISEAVADHLLATTVRELVGQDEV